MKPSREDLRALVEYYVSTGHSGPVEVLEVGSWVGASAMTWARVIQQFAGSGEDNYLGPHDGRHMSTTALEALTSGRAMPLKEDRVVELLRSGRAEGFDEVAEQLIETEVAEGWNIALTEERGSHALDGLRPPNGRLSWLTAGCRSGPGAGQARKRARGDRSGTGDAGRSILWTRGGASGPRDRCCGSCPQPSPSRLCYDVRVRLSAVAAAVPSRACASALVSGEFYARHHSMVAASGTAQHLVVI